MNRFVRDDERRIRRVIPIPDSPAQSIGADH
jgi:hypothetical protein